jgi:hypothetical protein
LNEIEGDPYPLLLPELNSNHCRVFDLAHQSIQKNRLLILEPMLLVMTADALRVALGSLESCLLSMRPKSGSCSVKVLIRVGIICNTTIAIASEVGRLPLRISVNEGMIIFVLRIITGTEGSVLGQTSSTNLSSSFCSQSPDTLSRQLADIGPSISS